MISWMQRYDDMVCKGMVDLAVASVMCMIVRKALVEHDRLG